MVSLFSLLRILTWFDQVLELEEEEDGNGVKGREEREKNREWMKANRL